MADKIHLDAPNLSDVEKCYLARAVESGYVSTIGPFVSEFEKKFSNYIGIKNSVSTQSGTAALHIALYELGIGKGDEVIVPALTFAATVNPVLYTSASPIFADVDKDTWNIDPREIEKLITKRTKAIIPVHLYGNPCEMDSIIKIARRHGLHIIEDATESLGALYHRNHTGTLGDFGCFSFNGNKVITTGGGGMVVGKSMNRLKHIRYLINQSRDEADDYYHSELGFNYRMTNLEAAVGLAQLKRIENFLSTKRIINNIYREELCDIRCLDFQKECEGGASSWWLSCVTLNKKVDIGSLQRKLERRGVPTRRVFVPLTEFPMYRACRRNGCQISYDISARSLCLPSSTLNSENDIYRVCGVLKEILDK